MKIEDAMELIILAKGKFLESPEKYEALQMGKEALEKQIPKKPIDDGAFGKCAACGYILNSELVSEYNVKYCPDCGQRLEW